MNEDLQSSEESAFVLEDVNLIIKEARARRICDTSAACVALSTLPSCTTLQAIDTVLSNTSYQHTKVAQWTSNVIESCMKRLKDLNKPFKYIVTAVIMQKNGAGLHTATSTFWDITTDGSATVRWESKTMYCIATVRPRAATLRRGRIVLTVMRRAGLWVGDLNCVACQHAHFAMQESKTRQVVAHPTPLDEVGVEAYSLALSERRLYG